MHWGGRGPFFLRSILPSGWGPGRICSWLSEPLTPLSAETICLTGTWMERGRLILVCSVSLLFWELPGVRRQTFSSEPCVVVSPSLWGLWWPRAARAWAGGVCVIQR